MKTLLFISILSVLFLCTEKSLAQESGNLEKQVPSLNKAESYPNLSGAVLPTEKNMQMPVLTTESSDNVIRVLVSRHGKKITSARLNIHEANEEKEEGGQNEN